MSLHLYFLGILQIKKFTNQMQDGWGLATDGKVLFGSDGTSTMYQIDPQTMKGLRHLMLYLVTSNPTENFETQDWAKYL